MGKEAICFVIPYEVYNKGYCKKYIEETMDRYIKIYEEGLNISLNDIKDIYDNVQKGKYKNFEALCKDYNFMYDSILDNKQKPTCCWTYYDDFDEKEIKPIQNLIDSKIEYCSFIDEKGSFRELNSREDRKKFLKRDAIKKSYYIEIWCKF